MSSFLFFSTQKVQEMKKVNPGAKMNDLNLLATEEWKTLTPEARLPFEKLYKEDKARQELQKKSLDKKGYFLLEDGSKSTDDKNLPPRKHKKEKESKSDEDEKPKRKP